MFSQAPQDNARTGGTGVKGSSLGRGLYFGPIAPRFYAFSASYNCWKEDATLQGLVIDPQSVRFDIQGFYNWTAKFDAPPPETYSYSKGSKGVRDGATAKTIRRTLQERPRVVPVFIYVALHTERHDEHRFFMPANRPGESAGPVPQRMISYTEFSELLSASSNPSSVALLTESCYSDNTMHLPYRYLVERVDGELRVLQEETGYPKHDWESKPLMVQFAATSPDEQAAWYPSTGAVYTQALFKYPVGQDLGFEKMMIRIQKSMDAVCKHPQRHVVYSSRIIQNNEDILSEMGFKLKPSSGTEPDHSN